MSPKVGADWRAEDTDCVFRLGGARGVVQSALTNRFAPHGGRIVASTSLGAVMNLRAGSLGLLLASVLVVTIACSSTDDGRDGVHSGAGGADTGTTGGASTSGTGAVAGGGLLQPGLGGDDGTGGQGSI